MAKNKGKRKLIEKLLNKYRLIILNDETFEEKLNFKISRLSVFILTGVSSVLLVSMTIVLIAFTPLREYIPGYSSTKLRKQAVELIYKTDSLENVIRQNNRYFNAIQSVLSGNPISEDYWDEMDEQLPADESERSDVDLTASETDSLLRMEVEQKEKYNVLDPAVVQSDYKLFPPVKGRVTEGFNAKTRHYGVDVSLAENSPVKATAEGTVIFSEWTAETGFVIIIEHNFGLISVYKHNSSLTKNQGESVKAGEVIALTGNTGEYTTGPHLHFELWSNGNPVNPIEFIDFE